jgi:type I restriction enzyme S subunit
LTSQFVYRQALACATGTGQKTVPLSGLRGLLIPVPPAAEQMRIVAKVNELMAVCDGLEAALSSAQRERERLLEALLHEALNGARSGRA